MTGMKIGYVLLIIGMGLSMASCAHSEKRVSSAAQIEFVEDAEDQELLDLEGYDFDGDRFAGIEIPEILRVCNSSHVDLKRLQKLIEDGADPNERYRLGIYQLSPITVLCNRSEIDEEALRYLLEQGVDVDGGAHYGRLIRDEDNSMSPIELALNRSKVDMGAVKVLFEKYKDGYEKGKVYYFDEKKDLVKYLNIVSDRSRVDVHALRELVGMGADVNGKNERGMTALMTACERRRIDKEAIRTLIGLGADINLGNDKNNDTAVMIATDRYGFDKEAVSLLLDSGADVNVVAKNGTTLLHSVIRDLDLTKRVLKMGADPDALDETGANILLHASHWGTPEVVRYLIEQGFKVNSSQKNNWFPITCASYTNRLDVVELLVDMGADIHVTTDQGSDLLTVACYERTSGAARAPRIQNDVIRYLIGKGLSAKFVNQTDGWTALLEASAQNYDVTETIGLLLDEGADIHHQANNGKSVLMVARDPKVAKFLIEKGADLDVVDNKGRTALNYALRNERSAIVRILIDAGANPAIKDKDGKDALYYAKNSGDLQYILDHGGKLDENAINIFLYGLQKNGQTIDSAFTKVQWREVIRNGKKLLTLLRYGAKSKENLKKFEDYCYFENEDEVREVIRLFVDKDNVNTYMNSSNRRHSDYERTYFEGTLLYQTLKEGVLLGVKLTPTKEEILRILELGARVDADDIYAYLTNSQSYARDNEVLTKLLDKCDRWYCFNDEYLYNDNEDYYWTKSKSGGAGTNYPMLTMIIRMMPMALPIVMKKYRPDPNVQIIHKDVNFTHYDCFGGGPCPPSTYEEILDFRETPLMMVVSTPEYVKLLLDAGASVNVTTSKGETALMKAVRGGYTESVRMLIEAGADVNAVNDDKQSVLSLAREQEIVRILTEQGAVRKTKPSEHKVLRNNQVRGH